MKHQFKRVTISFILVMVFVSLSPALELPGRTDHQTIAANTQWNWEQRMAGPLWCIGQAQGDYDILLKKSHKNRDMLRIEIRNEDHPVFAWDGHFGSVFIIRDSVLYYARFSSAATGGAIVAVDLKTGKPLWDSQLAGLGEIQHLAYSNQMNIGISEDYLFVYGKESLGRYFEIKSIKTGETLGRKIFSVESKR